MFLNSINVNFKLGGAFKNCIKIFYEEGGRLWVIILIIFMDYSIIDYDYS